MMAPSRCEGAFSVLSQCVFCFFSGQPKPAHVQIARDKEQNPKYVSSEKHLAPVDHFSVLNNQNFTIYVCLFLFAFLAQQATYIVSGLFVGRFSVDYVFGNTGQLGLNAVFFSALLYGVFRLVRYLFEKFTGRRARDVSLLSGFLLVIPPILFARSIRPASVPHDLSYRGCAVRIGGELTSCGLWSAASDLFAVLLVSTVIVTVFQRVEPRDG